jgi:hypothetical protein
LAPTKAFTGTLSYLTLGLFVGMVLLLELGRYLGQRRIARSPGGAVKGLGAVEGAVYGLMGLLLAFTFSGAAERFDVRRHLIVEEANAIGTAYLRLDLLPEEDRAALRQSFRDYLDSRLEIYRLLPDLQAAGAALERSDGLQLEIWSRAVPAAQKTGTPQASMLLLPALNEMFDVTTTRTAAAHTHPPAAIYMLLAILALASAFLVGFSMAEGGRNWIHSLAFAVFLSLTLYVIVDLEFPRTGLIRVDSFDQILVDLRRGMDPAR